MTHLEPLDPIRLFAARPDPAFGDNGGVTLPAKHYANGLLPTHGAIYVDVENYAKSRREIHRYTEEGKLDTSWGDNGVIVPDIFPHAWSNAYTRSAHLVMAYDARTRGLLVGFADGTVIDIERFTADGKYDTTWGNSGHIEYHERQTDLKLGAIKTLSNKRVLIALDRSQQLPAQDVYYNTRNGADDTVLVRLDRLGRLDRTFNRGRPLTVAAGSYYATYKEAKHHVLLESDQSIADPTFQDVQVIPDGGYRVITTRSSGRLHTVFPERTYNDDDQPITTGRTTISAASTTVSDGGVIVPERSQTYVLRRSADENEPYPNYSVILASAVGDDGVAVLSARPLASVTRFTPRRTWKPVTLPFPKEDSTGYTAVRGPDNRVLVEDSGPAPTFIGAFVRLNADLSVDTRFGTSGAYRPATEVNFENFSTDDTGRMVSEEGDQTRVIRRVV